MSDQDSSSSASQTEGEVEAGGLSSFSSSLRAVVRIKQKYQAMKKRRLEAALPALGGDASFTGAPTKTSPKIFTFDELAPYSSSCSVPQKKKRRRRKGVQYPTRGRRRAPPKPAPSRAKYCLYLLCVIVFVQVRRRVYI